jgi:hypothetical protein
MFKSLPSRPSIAAVPQLMPKTDKNSGNLPLSNVITLEELICTVAPPALLVFTWHLQYAGKLCRSAHTAIWAVVMLFIVYLPIHRQLQWHPALFLPTGVIALSDTGQWQEFQWLQQHTSPTDTIFNNPADNIYLSLRNPMHVEFANNDNFTSSRDVQLIIDKMKNGQLDYVTLDPGVPLDLARPRSTLPKICSSALLSEGELPDWAEQVR